MLVIKSKNRHFRFIHYSWYTNKFINHFFNFWETSDRPLPKRFGRKMWEVNNEQLPKSFNEKMWEAYAIYARKFLPRVYPQDSYRGGDVV